MSEWKTSERKQFNILCGNAQLLECPQCGTLSVVDFAYCITHDLFDDSIVTRHGYLLSRVIY